MIEEEWLKHARANLPFSFPRDYGLKRRKVVNRTHYLTSVKLARRNKKSAYVAVYSDYEVKHNIASTVYYDFDSDNGVEDLMKEVEKLSSLDFKNRIYFTGGRGVHLFVDFSPSIVVDLKGASKHVLDQISQQTGADFDNYLDDSVIGDRRRMCRVPYTYHENTGREMILLWEGGHKDIGVELYKKFGKKRLTPIKSVNVCGFSLTKIPPCVEMCIELLRLTGELSHEARVFLATYLLKSGFSSEEIHEVFKLAKDYRYDRTQYQLNYIASRNIRCYSCIKLKQLNICPVKYAKCEFYPNIEWFM